MAKRAITDAAKAEKSQDILECAAHMLINNEYEKVKMSDIARNMGISNGILFVYFKTKATLFVALLMREYNKRIDRIIEIIDNNPVCTFEDFKNLVLDDITELIDNNPLYVRLALIHTTILEKNSDFEVNLKFKTMLYERMFRVSKIIEQSCKDLTPYDIMEIFQVQDSILIGYKSATNLPGSILTIIDEQKLDGFRVDFRKSTIRAMELYLDGFRLSIQKR